MLLTVNNLKTHFRVGFDKTAKAINGVSFEIKPGKTLALVGESGCGKSQTAFSIMRLIAENGFHPEGKITFNNQNLMEFSEEEMREIRGNDIAMIFQEPMTSLNPLFRIGNQLEEPLRLHRNLAKGPARLKVLELLKQVGIPDPENRIDNFPHELSGGMKQRVMIAMSLACEPKVLIADEPTTALDVTIQAQVLKLMADLQKQTGMAILLITHDLGIVNQMADEICVMYAGKIVEQGSREQILKERAHPYTRKLFDSIPKDDDSKYYLNTIDGIVPPATEYGEGCLFNDRCSEAIDRCARNESPLHPISKGHQAACHLLEDHQLIGIREIKKKRAPERNVFPEILIETKDLKTWFPVRRGVFRRIATYVKAVDSVDLVLKRGSTVGLVGESGCGKTTLGESILRLNAQADGEVLYKNQNILGLNTPKLKQIRKYLQAVFQDPYGALSPRMTIEEIVGEGLRVHYPDLSSVEKLKKIENALAEVGLPPTVVERYPHEFSGGQRQRIGIARALILEPEFILLDEPTSALDVSVQAQVLNLLRDLQHKKQLTYLFITHNLSVVRYIADTVGIMYLGRIVEYGTVEEIFKKPRHPYTKSLLGAVPSLTEKNSFEPLVGDVPSPLYPPKGCHFHPRCPIYLNEPEGSPLRNKCHTTYPDEKGTKSDFTRCYAV